MRQLPTGTLTLFFTDIEGSTRLLQQLGDRYAGVLRDCRRLLRTAFQLGNGYEVDTQGDAFFVVFERAVDAVTSAITAQRALFTNGWPDEVQVRVRIGIHTGEPQLAEDCTRFACRCRPARTGAISSQGHCGLARTFPGGRP